MQITRRNALLGATAAAAVTGLTVAPLAMKAAGVKAALAGDPLIALEAELMEARAAGNKVGALYCAAYDKAGDWAFGWPVVDFRNPGMNLMRGWLHHNGFGGANENRVSLDCVKSFNRHTEKLVFLGDEVLARRKAEGRERIRWWIKARRAQEAAQALEARCGTRLDRAHGLPLAGETLDCRAAIHQSVGRSEPGIFRRWHDRGLDHRPVENLRPLRYRS